ncbi:MAG: CotH kinase family protein [Vicinamibacterales bacterium]
MNRSAAFWRLLTSTVLLVLCAIPPGAHAQPQGKGEAATLFDDSQLPDVRLRMNRADWLTLTENYLEDTYYPADFVWKDQVVRNVGIRSRGSGSRSRSKPGLKVDFNEYVSGQRFLGLNEVVLDNLTQDPSMIRERLAMKLFARMGLPAPRETFVKLWINDEIYLGVYALVESIDKRFLRNTDLDTDGYLFDYEYQDMWWFTHLGERDYHYQIRFDPETHDEEPPSVLYASIRQLLQAVNEPRDIAADIGAHLDVTAFVRYLAVEAFLAEWDGVVGDFGVNNFYLFRPSASARHVFIPWDKDQTFKAFDYPVWPDGMNNNILTEKLMSVPSVRQAFLDAVVECANLSEAPVEGGQTGWLAHEIARQYAVIAEAAHADNRKPHNNDTFNESVALLREFAARRPAFARSAVGRYR